MTLNEGMSDFSALTASRHSMRAFINREVPAHVLKVILKDAATAPNWLNARASCLTLATDERAQRLCEHYGCFSDEGIKAHTCKAKDPTVEISAPDDDCPVCKYYPDELYPVQTEIAKPLYKIYGVERGDIEGRNRANRRNVVAFNTPAMGFVFVHEDMLPWSMMDVGLMFQTLSLSMKSRGVDSCPAGILVAWREPMDAGFGIPEHYCFIADFAFSYVDPEAPINAMKAPHSPI